MITGTLKSQVDRVWDAFWSGGISNPLEVIEQITYLLFLRRLDEIQALEENKAQRLAKPLARRIFPEGNDSRGRPYQDLRWSRFRNFAPDEMYEIAAEHVFPFLRTLGGEGSTYAAHMKDARFTIPTPRLLAKVVDLIAGIPMEDRDTKGDLYEYMLSKIATAGQNGQFRTPRHIIELMVELVAPTPNDFICDPACGTCGFLIAAAEYLRRHQPGMLLDETPRAHFHKTMFHGFDSDTTMLRIGRSWPASWTCAAYRHRRRRRDQPWWPVDPRRRSTGDWWVEREELARAHSNGNGDGGGPQTNGHLLDVVDELVTKPQPGDPDLLSISILGRFEIGAAGTDLSSDLLGHKVAAYIVVYLMARTILNRKLRLTKAELADELSPGITPDKQRKRLTNRLTDMKSELPGELMARIAVAPKGGDDSIVFDLSRTSIDYDRLLALAEECATKGGLLPPELAQEADAVLAASEGEVLPIWDELEQLVNGARGAGGDFVRDLRQRAEDARVTIMGELAANHLARHEAGQAIPLLERALDRQPDREDLARKLRMAYLETGQHGRAAELKKAHALEA